MNNEGDVNHARRTYRAPRREAAAAGTRQAIVVTAKRVFEERGWAGATMRTISADAGVSQKTVEAIYGTKARLLEAVVEYAIRGDVEPTEMLARDAIASMEEAPDASSMLTLHAAHLRRVLPRSAGIAWVVEHAARGDQRVAALWAQMNRNRGVGVRWAARTLLAKPDTGHLESHAVEPIFWVALDWGTYRLLTEQAGLDDDGVESWIAAYYRAMLLSP